MIHAVLVINNNGKARLSKFYSQIDTNTQQSLIEEIYLLLKDRPPTACNFLEGSSIMGGKDVLITYRHYATLYFVFVVDESESALGMLDLIQVVVEALDKCFPNVCELDLVFQFEPVHAILSEVICGGLVLETNVQDIVAGAQLSGKIQRSYRG